MSWIGLKCLVEMIFPVDIVSQHDKKEKLVRKSWLFELVNKFPLRDYEQFIWRWTPIQIMLERSSIFQTILLLKEILGWFLKGLPKKICSQFVSAKRVEKLGRPLLLSPWTRSAFCECLLHFSPFPLSDLGNWFMPFLPYLVGPMGDPLTPSSKLMATPTHWLFWYV